MAVITHANPHASMQTAPQGRHAHFSARRVCLGVLLLCIGIAALALPLVRDALNLVQAQAHWKPLEHWLAQAPMASWLMMFVWGACIPAALLAGMHWSGHKIATAASMLVLMWVAITWYVHMPTMGLCSTLYPESEIACSALQWAGSMSLGLATAAYVFLMLGLAISALDLLIRGLDDDALHAG